MSKEKFQKYYQNEKVTSTYDDQRLKTEYRREKRKIELEIFLDLLDKQEGENVLELGCSSGFLTQYLGKVTAIDTSKDMLEIAHKKNPLSTVLEADMFNLPFNKNSFDKIVTMRVWTHLNKNDLRSALKQVKRVLKDEGYLVFDVEEKCWIRGFIHFFYKKIFRITGYKIYPFSLNEIKNILSEEGFNVNEIKFLKHKIGRQIVLKAKVKGEKNES